MSTNEDDLLRDRGDWLRTAEEVRTATVSINQDRQKELQYSPLDGMAVFEGDIVLGTEEEMEEARAGGTLVPRHHISAPMPALRSMAPAPWATRRTSDHRVAGLLKGFVQMTMLPQPTIPGWNSGGTIAPVYTSIPATSSGCAQLSISSALRPRMWCPSMYTDGEQRPNGPRTVM